jgi:hypothetical protein
MRSALLIIAFLAVLAGVMLVVNSPAPSSLAQTDAPIAQGQSVTPAPDPPGTIDGAKNPELIPDHVAYRMIVLAVAEPADATDERKKRARAKISAIGFSEDDAAAFLTLLGEFQTQAEAVDRQVAEVLVRAPIPHPASTDYRQLVDLGKQRDQLLDNTVAAFPARLSQDGLARLQAFLAQAKKGMKYVPDPLM